MVVAPKNGYDVPIEKLLLLDSYIESSDKINTVKYYKLHKKVCIQNHKEV